MTRMTRYALLLAALVLGTGCKKIEEKIAQKAAEKALEAASGGDVKVDTSSGSVTVTDPKTGTSVVGGNGTVALPAGWPASVPVYPGASVRSSILNGTSKSVVLATKDGTAKVRDFYKGKMKLESEMDLGAQRMMVFKSGAGNVTVTIGEAGADTMVSITVVPS